MKILTKIRMALLGTTTLIITACVAPISTDNAIIVPTPVGVPVLIQENTNSVHVCKIKAFTKTYQAENTSRGKAFLDVKKQCTARFDDMFCRDEDVSCTEYQ